MSRMRHAYRWWTAGTKNFRKACTILSDLSFPRSPKTSSNRIQARDSGTHNGNGIQWCFSFSCPPSSWNLRRPKLRKLYLADLCPFQRSLSYRPDHRSLSTALSDRTQLLTEYLLPSVRLGRQSRRNTARNAIHGATMMLIMMSYLVHTILFVLQPIRERQQCRTRRLGVTNVGCNACLRPLK